MGIAVKYNIIGYLIGEGFRNAFKNTKSTLACLGIMCATMLIFGFFFAITENINHIIKQVEAVQGIQVFIKNEATDDEIKELEAQIEAVEGVNNTQFKSKEDALNQMKEKFGDKQHLLDGITVLPASYIVTLTDLTLSSKVQEAIAELDYVKNITSSDDTINKLISIANGVRLTSAVILVLLVLISIFIISNTIKLTVHARRKEISIMKYVGATNGFIRWPFIVEGIIIGLAAGLISMLIIGFLYNSLTDKILGSSFNSIINASLLLFSDMFGLILIVYAVLGIGIGIIGSSISMKKYLNV